jgi:hypothetical protein
MSAVSEIIDLIEAKLVILLPTYKQLPFVYNPELNERNNSKSYGVRIGSGSSVSGTNNSVTVDHSIPIDLVQKYAPKVSNGDKDLRDKIKDLSDDIEILYKDLYRRPGAIASATLLLIAPVDVSEPVIDNDNNLVTITLTLSVKYRVAT